MKYLSIITIILISGCSSQPVSHQVANVVFGKVFEKTTNSKVSDNTASCPIVKRTCSTGTYKEWYQNNGKKACACNK